MGRIRIGRPDVRTDAPAHTPGVKQGNKGPFTRQAGHLPDGRATAERSTGVNASAMNPIDPRMPTLTPA